MLYASSAFFSVANGNTLDLSTIGVFQVTFLAVVALVYSVHGSRCSIPLSGLPCSVTACWFVMMFCCSLVVHSPMCFKLLSSIAIKSDKCTSLPDASQNSGAFGMVSMLCHQACTFFTASLATLSNSRFAIFVICACGSAFSKRVSEHFGSLQLPQRVHLLQKTQHFKCYLSKPIACKEDPHWFRLVKALGY